MPIEQTNKENAKSSIYDGMTNDEGNVYALLYGGEQLERIADMLEHYDGILHEIAQNVLVFTSPTGPVIPMIRGGLDLITRTYMSKVFTGE